MKKTLFFYDNNFKKLDFGEGHPMRGDRYEKAILEFKKIGLLDKLIYANIKLITRDIIELFHTKEYIDKVEKANIDGFTNIGEDTPSYKGIYDIALLSVSASISAVDSLINGNDIAINLCGGWHHAFENMGRGFCIFNDIAIVSNYLTKKHNIKKIMIIDYDAHHGDGSQRAFYNRSDVFTISFHENPKTLYPFLTGYENEIGIDEGKGFNKNYPLSTYCEDEEFIRKFSDIELIIKNFKPEFVILQFGVDGSKECLLSNMQLTEKSYDYASKFLGKIQNEFNFKLLVLGGGGFVHPMLGKNWGIQILNFINS